MANETKILYGKPVANLIEENVKRRVLEYRKLYGEEPLLATILVGNDKASMTYIKTKSKACERVGIKYQNIALDDDCSEAELLETIDRLNNDESVSAILLQHPIPRSINERECFDAIAKEKDADGVNSYNFGRVALNSKGYYAATALAIWKILKYYNVDLGGKEVVIIGRSAILGKPLAMIMLNEDATVTICHSKSKDLKKHLKTADIILSCVGVKGLFKESDLKKGAIVCDAGFDEGKGDYQHEDLGIVDAYTPVPLGVGPVTVACLVEQTAEAAWSLKLKK